MSHDITVTVGYDTPSWLQPAPRRVSRTRRVARWVGRAFIEWGQTIGEGYYWQG